MKHLSLEGQKYFLTPVCLVPNGRAHLGHISGPLLKMDVLRRHLVRAGADVCMISLSDSHESHVPIRAHVNGSTPEQVGNQFHDLIVNDLQTLRIAYDDLINPLDPSWAGRYDAINRKVIDLILQSDNAEVRSEPVPHLDGAASEPPAGSLRPRLGDPVVSGWLKGQCPFCDQPLVGFFCEACGGHFSPHEMIRPGTAHFEGTISLRERASLFLALKDGPARLSRELRRIGVRADFVEIAERYMRRRGTSIRLSVPSPWGLELSLPGLPPGEVIWSYSALIYGCHLLAGERYRELTGAAQNPMEVDSGVTCILSFGIDNTVPFLVGVTGCALAQNVYKPFDGLLVNYFYDLDGAKFSTSRDHVVWGGDVVKLGGADADLARAYLCAHGPEFTRANFDIDGFIAFHNALGRKLRAAIDDAFQRAEGATELEAGVLRHLESDLTRQAASLEIATFDLAQAWSVVTGWLHRVHAFSATSASAATWLAGFALLASPILPGLAQWVWSELGLRGEPKLEGLPRDDGYAVKRTAAGLPLKASHLTRVDFNGCLPLHLRR